MINKLLIALCISLLSGCINLGDNPKALPSMIYVLADAHATQPGSTPVIAHTLLVEDTHANVYDDNEALVFSRTPNTRARYKFARWSERPSTRLSGLLFSRLAEAKLYTDVVAVGSDVIADRRLATELLTFYHDATSNPGHVHVTLRAELYDIPHHRLIVRRLFEQDVPVASYDAAGAAAAFNIATQALLNDISAWLSATDSATHGQ